MFNPNIEVNEKIINKYKELDLKKHFMLSKKSDEEQPDNMVYLYQKIRKKILKTNKDARYVTDILIKYLYEQKQSNHKTTLWECFGDIIVENLKNNVKSKNTYCEVCGVLIEQTNNKKKYCDKCAKEIKNEQNKNYYNLGK
jgi:hypothetical protein